MSDDTPITELGLPTHTVRALQRAAITTLGALHARYAGRLAPGNFIIHVPGIGPASLGAISQIVDQPDRRRQRQDNDRPTNT